MSLDIAPHPGKPGPDELVPSRYAVRIGEIDVLVISDGVLPLPTEMLGHNVGAAVRATWLNDMFLPPDAFDWALNVLVVRSGDQTILVDTGLGADPNLNLPRAGKLIHRLEAAGIDHRVRDRRGADPHAHGPHWRAPRGRISRSQLRPDLRIHVAAAEVKFWESPDFTHVHMPPGFPDALRSGCQAILRRRTATSCGSSTRSTR